MSKHNISFFCKKCPERPYPKSKNSSLFSGSIHNSGSLLSPGMTHARNIHNSLIGKVAMKSTIHHNKLNAFGKYSGAPGGSSGSPKNAF